MVILYGIKNCDTVKKARQWLDAEQIRYQFHDFRADGLDRRQVEQWVATLGAEKLINKRSTTWKQLADSDKSASTPSALVELIMAYPTLIRRPLLDREGSLHCGFKPADYASLFQTA